MNDEVYSILGPFNCKGVFHQIAGVAFDHVGNTILGDSKHTRLLYFNKNQFTDNSKGRLLEVYGIPKGLHREELLAVLLKPFPHYTLDDTIYDFKKSSLLLKFGTNEHAADFHKYWNGRFFDNKGTVLETRPKLD